MVGPGQNTVGYFGFNLFGHCVSINPAIQHKFDSDNLDNNITLLGFP